MFVAAQRNLSLSLQPVQITEERWGSYRDHVTAQGSTVTIECSMDTDRQKDAVKVKTKRGYGFFHIQTDVRAATVLLNDRPTASEGDTHKAIRFGSTTVGPVRATVVDVDPRGFITFEGRQQPRLPHVDAEAIFFCTETAPMLTEFLMDAWDNVDSTALSRALFHESAALGLADGATFGLIGAGLRVGTMNAMYLGGALGAVGGGALGAFMGYIRGRGLSRAKAHDEALQALLTLFLEFSADTRRFERVTEKLQVLREANSQHLNGPFGRACDELRAFIDARRAQAQAPVRT